MIDVDTFGPLHGSPGELEAFVRAVIDGLSTDEGQWLECKSSLDLTTRHAQFHVARAILGFANRIPAIAERTCGGWAYLVVGAEPGGLAGIDLVDDTDLLRWVAAYIGPDGDAPEWTPEWVHLEGRFVLVAAVAPPCPGATIWTLRKQHTEHAEHDGKKKTTTTPEAAIFVRTQTATQPATTAHVRALVERARDPDVQLRIQRDGIEALAWLDDAASQAEVGELVAARRRAALEQHPELRSPAPPKRSGGIDQAATAPTVPISEAVAQMAIATARLGSGPKAVAVFRAEVDAWANSVQVVVWSQIRAAFDRRTGPFVLRLVNDSNAHLRGVKVVIDLPAAIRARYRRHTAQALPPEPEPYRPFVGIAGPPFVAQATQLELGDLTPHGGNSDVTIETVSGDCHQLVYDIADLRRGHPEPTAPVWLDLDDTIASNTLQLTWTATVARPQAWDLSGTVIIDVAPAPVTVDKLRNATDDGSDE